MRTPKVQRQMGDTSLNSRTHLIIRSFIVIPEASPQFLDACFEAVCKDAAGVIERSGETSEVYRKLTVSDGMIKVGASYRIPRKMLSCIEWSATSLRTALKSFCAEYR